MSASMLVMQCASKSYSYKLESHAVTDKMRDALHLLHYTCLEAFQGFTFRHFSNRIY